MPRRGGAWIVTASDDLATGDGGADATDGNRSMAILRASHPGSGPAGGLECHDRVPLWWRPAGWFGEGPNTPMRWLTPGLAGDCRQAPLGEPRWRRPGLGQNQVPGNQSWTALENTLRPDPQPSVGDDSWKHGLPNGCRSHGIATPLVTTSAKIGARSRGGGHRAGSDSQCLWARCANPRKPLVDRRVRPRGRATVLWMNARRAPNLAVNFCLQVLPAKILAPSQRQPNRALTSACSFPPTTTAGRLRALS
jgi:hypothetical protein